MATAAGQPWQELIALPVATLQSYHLTIEVHQVKICIKCNISKPETEYYHRTPGVLANSCKECVREAKNKRYAENIDRMRENAKRYRCNNIEEHRRREREYSRINSDKRDARVSAFCKSNPDKVREYKRTYAKSAKGIASARRYREKLSVCDDFKIATASRNMLKRTLSALGAKKDSPTFKSIGYTQEDLKRHLESYFTDGMTWDNYGEWHIDHVIPVAEMIRLGVKCPKTINALGNLRPLWASENLSKGDSFMLVGQ